MIASRSVMKHWRSWWSLKRWKSSFCEGFATVGGRGGRRDVVPLGVVLAPERRAPGLVEGVDRAVALAQPLAKRDVRGGRVVVRHGRAVLVVDVPHDDGGVVGVALRERAGDAGDRLAVGGRRRRHHAAGSEAEFRALRGLHPRLRVGGEEPRGGRRGGRAEVDRDAVVVQQSEDLVEPREVEFALAHLDEAPREHADADEVHARLAHQPHVVAPRVARPLLGVVVAAVGEAIDLGEGGSRKRASVRCHGRATPSYVVGPSHLCDRLQSAGGRRPRATEIEMSTLR